VIEGSFRIILNEWQAVASLPGNEGIQDACGRHYGGGAKERLHLCTADRSTAPHTLTCTRKPGKGRDDDDDDDGDD
jgi:hypothetical protein